MKTFSKISSVIIVAAMATVFSPSGVAGDITVKPLRYQPLAQSLFVTEVTGGQKMICPSCFESYVPVVTQDSKLKTKTILVANHACQDCKTTTVRTGAQKATGKDVVQHFCGTMLASVETCCAGMK